MADYADLLAAETKKQEEKKPTSPVEIQASTAQSIDQSTSQSTNKAVKKGKKNLTSTNINQPVGQSISRSVNRLNSFSIFSKTVDRPKAFYITERLDKKLDDAVRYLQDAHGIKKADRSTIINAILDNEAYWTEESLDLLADRVIGQLTSRLTSK